MAETQEFYAEDEFDRLAAKRNTHGAHRLRRRRFGWVIALVAIVILAPVAGFLGSEWLANTGVAKEAVAKVEEKNSQSQAEAEKNAAKQKDAEKNAAAQENGAESAAEQGTNAAPEKSPNATPAPAAPPVPIVVKSAPISVLNATNVRGLAAEKAQVLRDAGFTQVSSENYRGSRIAASTVFYNGEKLADSAKKVAADLGLGEAVQSADWVQAGSIAVVVTAR